MKIWISNSAIYHETGEGYIELHVRDILGQHYETWYFDDGKAFSPSHPGRPMTKKRKRLLKRECKRLRKAREAGRG